MLGISISSGFKTAFHYRRLQPVSLNRSSMLKYRPGMGGGALSVKLLEYGELEQNMKDAELKLAAVQLQQRSD